MYPASGSSRHPPGPSQGGQAPLRINIVEALDRVKDEFQFLQAQYHNLKLELDKLATDKTEMQRHYVMYYEMSYGLNVEMHKQTEIAKRLNAIIAQIMPYLSAEHQQQVAAAVDRAKQVTMTELNSIIGQQMHTQQMPPHPHGHPPFMPHAAAAAAMAAGLGQTPGMPPASAAGLLALSALGAGGAGSAATAAAAAAAAGLPPHLPPVSVASGSASSTPANKDHRPEEKRAGSAHSTDDRHRNSFSPHMDRPLDIDRHRSRSPFEEKSKKRRENNDKNDHVSHLLFLFTPKHSFYTYATSLMINFSFCSQIQASEDERSDADLVVDVANEDPISPQNGDVTSPRENGASGDSRIKREPRPPSRSGSSSNSSTPVSKPSKDHLVS